MRGAEARGGSATRRASAVAGNSSAAYPLYVQAGVDLARPEPYQALMARMNRLFGVTMAEQGVSQLVSVDLKAAEALVG